MVKYMCLYMNKNNWHEKITIIEGFGYIFLSLLLVLAWFLFSNFSDQYSLDQFPVLTGTETKKLADGSYVTNYLYKNPPILYILQALSVTIIFLPILTTLSVMWRYLLSFKLDIKKFITSFIFLVWLEASFFFLSLFYLVLMLKPGNVTLWWEISFAYILITSLLITSISILILLAILFKQKFGKAAPTETYIQ